MSDWEMAACVVVNLNNLLQTCPSLSINPMFAIVMMQAQELESQLKERACAPQAAS